MRLCVCHVPAGTLLGLVSPQPSLRPAPACLASCPWVEGDQLLRALRFLEGMMQVGRLQVGREAAGGA